MPTFSKFITSQRGAEQLLDSDGYIYSRKKSKDTALTSKWICSKYNPRRSASSTATSPCQTTLSPLGPSPTTTLLMGALQLDRKSSPL